MKPFDENGNFSKTVAHGELGGRAVRGAGITLLSGGLGLTLQMVATVVLARLLTPADFGLVAMATTFSMLFLNFGVNGFTEAIIQRREFDHRLASNLFWINVCSGLLLTVGFAAGGALLKRFYGDPRVQPVAVALSVTILLTSVSVQHLALLKRAMRFAAVSANDIIARILSVAVSILLCRMQWGYWALVAGAVVVPLSTSIGAWILCRWTPGLPRRAAGTASTVHFALNAYGRFTVNYFARNVDNLLVGWRFGAFSLGFYKKAYDLFALPSSQVVAPLNEVALSALSRLDPRSQPYRQSFLRTLSILALTGMGLAADLTLVGHDLIRLVLGAKWELAGQIFTYFGPGIGGMFVYQTHSWLHLSIGRADRWLRWSIVEVSVTCLLFLAALPWGPPGIAVAWAASFWILMVPSLWYAGRPVHFGVKPMLGAIWRYILAAMLAGCAAGLLAPVIRSFIIGSPVITAICRIIMISALFAAGYLGALIVLHGGLKPLYQMASLLGEIMPRRRLLRPSHVGDATIDTFPTFPLVLQEAVYRPMVSILIPALNAEEWIADTLRSAIQQTWEPKEIIVVDDGSTDRTVEIARQFESEGVRVVTQKNQGAAAARNNAYALSKGDYIQWLDADDLLAPHKVASQIAAATKCGNKRTLLSGPFARFNYRYYRAEFVPSVLWRDLSSLEWLLFKLGQNVYMQTATWLVSRELAEASGPWDTRLLGDDDGEYFCRVLMASEGTLFVPEARVYYRAPTHAGLSYIGRSNKKCEAHWLSMQLHIGYLQSLEDSERVRTACVQYLNDSLIYFYPENMEIVEQMSQKATELHGKLEPLRLSWKYSWAVRMFGWGAAKRLGLMSPKVMWAVKRNWDKLLFRLEDNDFSSPAMEMSIVSPPPSGSVERTDTVSPAAGVSRS
jgi:PST family polysaccharide transporter